MSEEVRPSLAIEIIQQEHVKALALLNEAIDKRAFAQSDVEFQRVRADGLADFLAQQGEDPDYSAKYDEERARRREESHAVKFFGLTAPATVYPARGITLTITHLDCNSDLRGETFAERLHQALHEFADYQLNAESRSAANPPPEPRYPFTASNGCVVDVLAHVQVNPPEPVAGTLDPKTFMPIQPE